VAIATAVTAGFLLLALGVAWKAHRRPVETGDIGLVGRSGRVVSWNGNEGEVHVFGERWHARALTPLSPGQNVRVVARNDLTLVVEPQAQATPQP
jgi:membrane-bound serine protease (ClpP class)